MINNRIRTIVRTATGTALMASALGLSALGFQRGKRRPGPSAAGALCPAGGGPRPGLPGLLVPLPPRARLVVLLVDPREPDLAHSGLGPFAYVALNHRHQLPIRLPSRVRRCLSSRSRSAPDGTPRWPPRGFGSRW